MLFVTLVNKGKPLIHDKKSSILDAAEILTDIWNNKNITTGQC